jgi:hypothetical protein
MTTRLRFPFSGVSWTTPRHQRPPQTKKRAPRGIGGCVRREASIEGVRFRCKVQRTFAPSLTPHAPKPMACGPAIEACVPIPQVLWLLSSKESNNKNKHCTLFASRYGPCLPRGRRDAPVLGWVAGQESRATPVAPDSCPAAVGHGGAVSLQHCCFGRVRVVLNLDLHLCGVVDHSTTRTCAATKNPRPAESAAVCGGKLQSKRLGFGADCRMPFG